VIDGKILQKPLRERVTGGIWSRKLLDSQHSKSEGNSLIGEQGIKSAEQDKSALRELPTQSSFTL
jgi:hypothetical protein